MKVETLLGHWRQRQWADEELKSIEEAETLYKRFVEETDYLAYLCVVRDASEPASRVPWVLDAGVRLMEPEARAHNNILIVKRAPWCKERHMVVNLKEYSNTETTPEQRKEIQQELHTPAALGTFDRANLAEWAAYHNVLDAKISEVAAKNRKIKREFLECLKGHDVKWVTPDFEGYVTKGGLRFRFQLPLGSVEQFIEVQKRTRKTFKDFLDLADNKYQYRA